MVCVAVWRGFGVKSARMGLRQEHMCLEQAEGNAPEAARNFTGTAKDPQNRLFIPILIVEYILSCKSCSSVNPNSNLCGVLSATIASRRAPQGRRDFACAGTTVAAYASPSKNSARNLDDQFRESVVEMNAKMKISRMAGQRSLGATPLGSGCEITQPTAVLSSFWNLVRISIPDAVTIRLSNLKTKLTN